MRGRNLMLGVVIVLACQAQAALAEQAAGGGAGSTPPGRNLETSGIPTVAAVAALEREALDAHDRGDCETAVGLLELYSAAANRLATLIHVGHAPLGDSSRGSGLPMERLEEGARYETKSNEYKEKRNHAYIMQAECLDRLGRPATAIAVV